MSVFRRVMEKMLGFFYMGIAVKNVFGFVGEDLTSPFHAWH
jgi:hypothetical protein